MEQSHLQALSTLAETDPEFYKYLQENDKDLLNFGQDSDAEHSHNEDEPASSDDEDDVNAPPPQHESLNKVKKAASKKLAKEEEGDDSEFEGFEGGETDDEDEDEGGDMMGGEDEDAKRGKKGKDSKNQTTVLTMEMLRGWQKGMLEVSPFDLLSRSWFPPSRGSPIGSA